MRARTENSKCLLPGTSEQAEPATHVVDRRKTSQSRRRKLPNRTMEIVACVVPNPGVGLRLRPQAVAYRECLWAPTPISAKTL